MIAQIVAQSTGAAQVFFLVALILGIIVTIWYLVDRTIQAAILAATVTFIAVGLLFFA